MQRRKQAAQKENADAHEHKEPQRGAPQAQEAAASVPAFSVRLSDRFDRNNSRNNSSNNISLKGLDITAANLVDTGCYGSTPREVQVK